MRCSFHHLATLHPVAERPRARERLREIRFRVHLGFAEERIRNGTKNLFGRTTRAHFGSRVGHESLGRGDVVRKARDSQVSEPAQLDPPRAQFRDQVDAVPLEKRERIARDALRHPLKGGKRMHAHFPAIRLAVAFEVKLLDGARIEREVVLLEKLVHLHGQLPALNRGNKVGTGREIVEEPLPGGVGRIPRREDPPVVAVAAGLTKNEANPFVGETRTEPGLFHLICRALQRLFVGEPFASCEPRSAPVRIAVELLGHGEIRRNEFANVSSYYAVGREPYPIAKKQPASARRQAKYAEKGCKKPCREARCGRKAARTANATMLEAPEG